MENNQEQKTIKEEVLNKIEEGRAHMKPKWHFVLESTALTMAVFLVAFVLLGLISFVLFTLKQNGAIFAPGFGKTGFWVMARAMPWMLILFGVSLFVILEILMKNYAFAYRKPVLYSLVILFFFVITGSFLVHKAELHEKAFIYMSRHHIPVFGPMYLHYSKTDGKELHPGVVTLPRPPEGFYMAKKSGREVYVIFVEKALYPTGNVFNPGDSVLVLGIEEEGKIRAFGARKVEENFAPMHGGMMNFKLYAPAR